jgi:lysophospholipase L1-like esterase
MKKWVFTIAVLLIGAIQFTSFGQDGWTWTDPLESATQGIVHGKIGDEGDFSRLPDHLKGQVRTPVWNLSRHAAGLKLKFSTNASDIQVRYLVSGNLAMPHMPSTGVSGLDLYTKDASEDWVWIKGDYSFADTIRYSFSLKGQPRTLREFDLYLPLYNEVVFMQVGVPSGATFAFVPKSKDALPVVVYGTSIAQGACASRPGMAWTAILERHLHLPLVNLGFSGNGQLEAPLIQYMASQESSLYVLDCLPNLVRDTFSESEVKRRIRDAVIYLKSKRPTTPILLVEHAGYTDDLINLERKTAYQKRNQWSREVYAALLDSGLSDLFYLQKEAIGLSMDATVDGTHPSDLGMDQYAQAYARLVSDLLK